MKTWDVQVNTGTDNARTYIVRADSFMIEDDLLFFYLDAKHVAVFRNWDNFVHLDEVAETKQAA